MELPICNYISDLAHREDEARSGPGCQVWGILQRRLLRYSFTPTEKNAGRGKEVQIIYFWIVRFNINNLLRDCKIHYK